MHLLPKWLPLMMWLMHSLHYLCSLTHALRPALRLMIAKLINLKLSLVPFSPLGIPHRVSLTHFPPPGRLLIDVLAKRYTRWIVYHLVIVHISSNSVLLSHYDRRGQLTVSLTYGRWIWFEA